MLGRRFRSSDMRDKYERLFSNLRLLLGETQYSSDKTEYIPDIPEYFRTSTSEIRTVLKKNKKGEYILRKSNIRQKI